MYCFWLKREKRALGDLLSLITWSKHLLKYSHRSLIESLLPGLLSGLLTSRGQMERQHLLNCISKGATSTSAGGSEILQHPFLIYTPVPRFCIYIYKLCSHQYFKVYSKPCHELWICLWGTIPYQKGLQTWQAIDVTKKDPGNGVQSTDLSISLGILFNNSESGAGRDLIISNRSK